MHAATKPQVLGVLLVMTGAVIRLTGQPVVWMLVLVGVFQLLTHPPVSAHLVSRVAYRRRHVRRDLLLVDELGVPGPPATRGDPGPTSPPRARSAPAADAQRKSRDVVRAVIASGSIRSATRFTTPSLRSSRPCTTSAEDSRATRRCRAHTPVETITFTSPVSSSRLRNVVPPAVAGAAVGDHPAHPHPGARGRGEQPGRREHPGGVELGADVLHRVAGRGDRGGPQVGHRLLGRAHPGSIGGGSTTPEPGSRSGAPAPPARPPTAPAGG